MDYPLCERCGLDPDAMQERLRLLGLDQADMEFQGKRLHQHVIAPNIDRIVDALYGSLSGLEEFASIADDAARAARLRARHENYLFGLGTKFREAEYFEQRLRIGAVHQHAGVPQSLYQCMYQKLQGLLIDGIPAVVRDDAAAFEGMLQFILKITALDMSLAAESYYSLKVSDLAESLAGERDKSEQLQKLAVTDCLTNLPNHAYSRRCLGAALDEARTEQTELCIIMADLDRFKNINDEYGHLVGDEVLRIAAARMLSAARSGDEICRYGGEEFLFVLRHTSLREGADVAERVRARINSDAMHDGGRQIRLSLSLGLAQATPEDSVNSLIQRADEALYAAKRAGRNRVCVK